MATPVLRPYQREAVEAVLSARRSGVRRMVVCLPTGAGKTVIFSHLAALAKRQVLVLAHREELLAQAREKLERALGEHHVVALERGADRAQADAKVIVCSLRSLHEKRLAEVLRGRDFGLVIYDECHHAAADDNTRILKQLGAFDADWTGTLLGFTATTARGDGKGLDAVFERIVYTKTLPSMIEEGFLSKLRGFRVSTTADLSALSSGPSSASRSDGSDFPEDALAEAVDIEERNALVARSIQELARDRRTIAFCVNVNHARNLCKALNALGVPSGIVHGAMPSDVRAKALLDFREGRTVVLTNVAVLTEGFDDPEVSCIAMARPTRSEGLYAQCIGRGTRLAPGKTDCLVLDFVDLAALNVCNLPSLFGAPRNLDLQGEDVSVAARTWHGIELDYPGFELEARALTLQEIQDRAASFDPLKLGTDAEVRAISANAWFSLVRHGVGLHFERYPGKPCEVLVVKRARPTNKAVDKTASETMRKGSGKGFGRAKAWEIVLAGKVMDSYARMEEAVLAVDYEIEQMGRNAAASARPEAAWRKQKGNDGQPLAEALRLGTWERIVGAKLR